MLGQIRSATPGVVWPALPDVGAAAHLALLQQLEQSQWWSAERLQALQMRQIEALLNHAWQHIPLQRERLAASAWRPGQPLDPQRFASVPLCTRAELNDHGDAFFSPPHPTHGGYREGSTSGSTGRPIRFRLSQLFDVMWNAVNLRGYGWQGFEPARRMAYIQSGKDNAQLPQWELPMSIVYETGPAATLDIRVPVAEQAAWLQDVAPDYLFTAPTNLDALARHCTERGIAIPSLQRIRTVSEVLKDDTRERCAQAFGARLFDVYGASEAGTLATQCGEHAGYHVPAEAVYLEVLREDGSPCAVGETGQVVVTVLHNFAMPLIRYAIGDHAEVGAPCPCGRGLPTLARILGRSRNLLTYPDGRTAWPSFPSRHWMHIAPIRQLQLVQERRDRIRVRLAVAGASLSADQQARLREVLQTLLGYPFEMDFEILETLPLGPNHKFEDFVSRLA
jgi:phenylacetate-CoA ligase